MELRTAAPEDAALCYRCIEDARAYHRALGFTQWFPGYPSPETIREDIAGGTGFVFRDEGGILGYCCILIGDEPAYAVIDGDWRTDRPYAVVHRMAFRESARGRHLSHPAFEAIKAHCRQRGIRAVRIDTQAENTVMRHILDKEGFAYCGLIDFGGGPKLAYEWDAP